MSLALRSCQRARQSLLLIQREEHTDIKTSQTEEWIRYFEISSSNGRDRKKRRIGSYCRDILTGRGVAVAYFLAEDPVGDDARVLSANKIYVGSDAKENKGTRDDEMLED